MTFLPPSKANFRIRLHGGIYMPGRITPIEARLYGRGIFAFERTERPSIYSVQIEAISLQVVPFSMAFDIDGDGILESVEISEVDFSEFVDIENTSGSLNVDSNEFRIDWALQLSPRMIPLLSESTTMMVPDYGRFDPETGEFEIHRGVFSIGEGPLKGAIIRGSAHGCIGYNQIWLSIVIAGTNVSCFETLDDGGKRQKEVWACPGDTVALCWRTSPDKCNGVVHDRVEIEPRGDIIKLPENHILIAVPHDYTRNPIEYKATVMDAAGNRLATDTVQVHIYEGEWITFNAQPDTINMGWCIQIPPHSCSGKIVASGIQLLGNQQGCLPWKHFFVEHKANFSYPNPSLLGMQIDDYNDHSLVPPRPISGTWCLYSLDEKDAQGIVTANAPKPNDYHDPVCFRLRGACT